MHTLVFRAPTRALAVVLMSLTVLASTARAEEPAAVPEAAPVEAPKKEELETAYMRFHGPRNTIPLTFTGNFVQEPSGTTTFGGGVGIIGGEFSLNRNVEFTMDDPTNDFMDGRVKMLIQVGSNSDRGALGGFVLDGGAQFGYIVPATTDCTGFVGVAFDETITAVSASNERTNGFGFRIGPTGGLLCTLSKDVALIAGPEVLGGGRLRGDSDAVDFPFVGDWSASLGGQLKLLTPVFTFRAQGGQSWFDDATKRTDVKASAEVVVGPDGTGQVGLGIDGGLQFVSDKDLPPTQPQAPTGSGDPQFVLAPYVRVAL